MDIDTLSKDFTGYNLVRYIESQGYINVKIINGVTTSLLHECIRNDMIDEAKILLAQGIDGNIVDIDGNNALQCAIIFEKRDIVEILVWSLDIDLDHKNHWGYTALHLYIESNMINRETKDDIIEDMIEKVDINSINKNGDSPLHLAVCKKIEWLVKLLLFKGANAKARNFNNQTVLHYALYNGCSNTIINILTDRGIDVYAKDNSGTTCMDILEKDYKHLL